ncbi:hypothetical protein B0H11DRAFT_1925158 [Mycena galericulata]|nr:hypothetical protein B0H11DRAFT_1925158 [Mycena galericulata]
MKYKTYCISCNDVTFFIFPSNPPLSAYLGTVIDLSYPNTAEGEAAALLTIQNGILSNVSFVNQVLAHRDALPAHLTHVEIIDGIGESIVITPIMLASGTRTARAAWRVYGLVPTADATHLATLRECFRRIEFPTGFSYRGTVHPGLNCSLCPSIDHPTGLCPFPDTPGWMGITRDEAKALEQAAAAAAAPARGRGRGGRRGNQGGYRGAQPRGRGRGRGRGFF